MRTFRPTEGMPGGCRNSIEAGDGAASSLTKESVTICVTPREVYFTIEDGQANAFSLTAEDLRTLLGEMDNAAPK